MDTTAIVFEEPGTLSVKQLALTPPDTCDVVVETLFSGISTGTEKMLFEGSMPQFPGMGYPLVPGYESIATVVEAGSESGRRPGETVFVPGANCYCDAAGLFGASADRLVLPGNRTIRVDEDIAEDAVLLALAATAHRALSRAQEPVDVIIGHGVLGRLIARIAIAQGQTPPLVLESNPERRKGAEGYEVLSPDSDVSKAASYCTIDASGAPEAIDGAIAGLHRNGVLVLAGFYGDMVKFAFPPAFMREISISLSAEFTPEDTHAVLDLLASGCLSLKGLITHHAHPKEASQAYRTAFDDPSCLKMVIDWRIAS
ncbi:chlorophyll synthesis pathway protein BchC [Roseibium sp.]|uniref:chlorophyll synthesis pathway protein BchC n=1 Tax=Roseibium sp. TaxID=1936156 RepID=UPI003B4FF9D7